MRWIKDRKKWYTEQQKRKTKESQAWDEFFKIILNNFVSKWLNDGVELLILKKIPFFVIPFSLKRTT